MNENNTQPTNSAAFLPVLLGSDANVYGMARSFYEAYGVCSLAIGKGRLNATAHSRLVQVVVVEPRLEEDDVFCHTLQTFAQQHAGTPLVLVSCGDNYTKMLARNAAVLAPLYHFAAPTQELVQALGLKENFYKACDTHNIAYPKTSGCTYETYKTVQLPFDFPVIIKASNSVAYWNCQFPHKKKVFVAYNKEEFDAITEAIYSSSYKDHLVLQEYIPGDDNCMRVLNCYSNRAGEVKLMALGRPLLEEQSPEGIGNYASILSGAPNESDRAFLDKMRAFLEDTGWVGFANFDIKYDARDGSYKLFEMNPRQGRSSYFVTAAGYNLATWLVDDVLYNKPQSLTIADSDSLWMIAPAGILKKYLKDDALLAQANALMRAGKVRHQLWAKEDRNLRRWLWYCSNQYNYYRKYKIYNGNKSLRG